MNEQLLNQLTEKELLSEFLPEQSVDCLLHEYHSIYDVLFHTTKRQLAQVNGIGSSRANRLLALRELVTRVQEHERTGIKTIHGPEDAMRYFRFLKDLEQEEFWVLLLDVKNHVLGSKCITRGKIDATISSPREIFSYPVREMAAAIIAVHNHPSGEPEPSKEDIVTTRRLLNVGKLLSIPLLDHIIIAKYGDISLKEHLDF